MIDSVAQIVMKELYNYSVRYGENKEYKTFFPYVKDYNVGGQLNVPHIIPSNTYTPSVVASFDFTSRSTLPTGGEGTSANRPVTTETLQRVGGDLIKFFTYYFEYALSYGRDKKKLKGNGEFWNALGYIKNISNEEDLNLFINYVINFFITNISVDRQAGGIGTATLTIRDAYNITGNKKIRLFFDRAFGIFNQLFTPMVPVMVWAKGRMYKDWVFPLFTGRINAVSEANSEGFTHANITCKDVLEIARVSYEMVDPAIVQVGEYEKKTQEAINIFNKPFYGMDHFDIVNYMFVGGALKWDPEKGRIADISLATAENENTKNKYITVAGLGEFIPTSNGQNLQSKKPLEDSFLKQNGVLHKDYFTLRRAIQMTKQSRPRYVRSWGSETTPYRIWNTQSPKVFDSTFDTRLNVLQETSNIVYYELYVDGFGNVNYHPMRLGNSFLKYDRQYINKNRDKIRVERPFPGTQVFGNDEIISTSSVFNIEDLITFIHIEGFYPFGDADPRTVNLVGSYEATPYLNKFMYRRRSLTSPIFNRNPKINTKGGGSVYFLDAAAKELLVFMNSQLYTRQDNIIFRPELELCAPILTVPNREVFYCNSFSHSIAIGSEATTSVNSNFGRSFEQPSPDLYTLVVESENLYRVNVEKDQLPLLPGDKTYEKLEEFIEFQNKKTEDSINKDALNKLFNYTT